MELGTGLALFGTAKILEKILGPTASYFGNGLKDFTEKRVENVKSIFEKAYTKIIKIPESEIISDASPLVIKSIFDFGSYSKDKLIHEYLAGLLACSKVTSEDDNRQDVLCKIVESMTIFQIRTHFIMYQIIHNLYKGKRLNLGNQKERELLQTYISKELFDKYVFKNQTEKIESPYLYEHIMAGLHRNFLIEDSYALGSAMHLSKFGPPAVKKGGVLFQPSILGIELFLGVNCLIKNNYSNSILDEGIAIDDLLSLEYFGEACNLPFYNFE